MNKLLGFYELRHSSLPTIPWKEYTSEVELDENILWTIRTAVNSGNDLNLPRAVGIDSKSAKQFASNLCKQIGNNGLVVYYPYFIAEKSGTINIFSDKIVVEAVKNDLWNLVTYSDCEVTIVVKENRIEYKGNSNFIDECELQELLSNAKKAKSMFREGLLEGKSALLEWSYAYHCNFDKERVGNKYLVFYEARTVE